MTVMGEFVKERVLEGKERESLLLFLVEGKNDSDERVCKGKSVGREGKKGIVVINY